jgi:hypothetical protein
VSAEYVKFGNEPFEFEMSDHDNLGYVRFSDEGESVDVQMCDLGAVIEFLQKVKDREDALRDEFGF